MNPYATYLADRDPLEVISSTACRLRDLLDTLGAQAEQSPAPGKWSVREIIAHLADCEIAFGFRLRQTLAEEDHVMQPFDQDKWSKNYAAYDARTALAAFTALREFNVLLIRHVTPAANNKGARHPERGPQTFRSLVETMAGHDINHLSRIDAMGAKFAGKQ